GRAGTKGHLLRCPMFPVSLLEGRGPAPACMEASAIVSWMQSMVKCGGEEGSDCGEPVSERSNDCRQHPEPTDGGHGPRRSALDRGRQSADGQSSWCPNRGPSSRHPLQTPLDEAPQAGRL